MSIATVYTRAASGLDPEPVMVEVRLTGGPAGTSIVGLTETAVKEAKFRVRSALANAGFRLPSGHVIVHLAPADLPKAGGRFDLPIALAILAAMGELRCKRLGDHEFIGELGFGGELRPVAGVLPAACAAHASGRMFVVPHACAAEAALVRELPVFGARTLLEVFAHLNGAEPLPRVAGAAHAASARTPDLADVRGQPHARRALEVAAAGHHNLLLIGPPGTGKSMLATRLPGIMPPLTHAEALEVAAVASLSGRRFEPVREWGIRPFRAPHHSASHVALVGGGGDPRPGEISLAHHGVLFLDELPEFQRRTLEALREPLEAGTIAVSRALRQAEFPARFLLVAAMNPCPCGYLGDTSGRCRCSSEQVERYRARLSGPLLDRIDIQVDVPRVPRVVLGASECGEPSSAVRERVVAARRVQLARQGCANALLGGREVERLTETDADASRLLADAIDRLGLSARAYHRVLRVARTVADLAGDARVQVPHVAEAIAYRRLDRRL